MGYGDELMAIGDAWRLHQADPQKRRVAIGDGRCRRIDYPELTHGLDFLASEAEAASGELPWVISYRAYRPYHDHAAMRRAFRERHPLRSRLRRRVPDTRLVDLLGFFRYRLDYRPAPAPLVLTDAEQAVREQWAQRRFVLIEPHCKQEAAPGKRWPFERYAEVAQQLAETIEVWQVGAPETPLLPGVMRVPTHSFRDVLPFLAAARLYIGPEGGLHHAAAAMKTPAVVLFGGYTPPQVTGYDFHVCLTGNSDEACGVHHSECAHCRAAMTAITVDQVVAEARSLLDQ
ncbi:glycosyltransferase family 9 protein [Solimonas marina]|uniref:Glycosyltransferase family 9 protein n=1 Tax=Solimonas marina TaxID=2714601 RepID=A0A969WBQ9_9GAMM|nr:glycosyltransferase family 9 protein [Solimonas marina]NKF23609.1 glycosyltransferase family 9 protein [Solimonas marina]